MKYLLVTAIFYCGIAWSATHTLFTQLCEFNYNWKDYKDEFDDRPAIDFASDKEYIQTHLTEVLKVLRNNPTDHLNEAQLAMRTHLISVLDAYREEGLFPMNYYREERLPVFIDEHGTHCAVGFLMMETGYDHVAHRIASTNNYAWVKEIQDPALPEWQQLSGFTVAELKLIQGAYDSYIPFDLKMPNKYELPQKPMVCEYHFENSLKSKDKTIWLYGEGKDSVLHGRWIQNYSVGIPWIEGYFVNGKRSGRWKEYYPGTAILCRTEHWRNDLLNGVRTRYDKKGKVIETILFKDGEVELKTNFDYDMGLKFERVPVDSNIIHTKVYTMIGGLLAEGNEEVHNPGGLQWFQNIELTALNSFAISAQQGEQSRSYSAGYQSFDDSYSARQFGSFYAPPLVTYKKVGTWTYYSEYALINDINWSLAHDLKNNYSHLTQMQEVLDKASTKMYSQGSDSIKVKFENDLPKETRVYINDKMELGVMASYHVLPVFHLGRYYGYSRFNDYNASESVRYLISSVGMIDSEGKRHGEWKYYNAAGQLYKISQYLVAVKEDDEVVAVQN